MDAAPEPTTTYLRRVSRWWAGKGPATNLQIDCARSTAPRSIYPYDPITSRHKTTALQLRIQVAASSDDQAKPARPQYQVINPLRASGRSGP
ncbi:hypothetical protein XaplCFBP3123_12515 [Xanthomonas arboricola pv. populi]|nr:hypothetical protein XaplCFBP3123_12515 [Xanthomonas arboricola pv. populi]